MKIDLVAWGDAIGGLSLKTAKEGADLVAMPFQYTKAVKYSGPQIMEIYKSGNGGLPAEPELSEEDKERLAQTLLLEPKQTEEIKVTGPKKGLALELEKRRKEKPTLVALAQLPGNCRHATVLLVPVENGTFHAYVIDDDPTKLPKGQMRIHNLCAFPVAMKINGKKRTELKTRDSMVVALPNEVGTYELEYQIGDKWKIHENNFMMARAHDQTQMIVLKSGNQFFRSPDGSTGGFLQVVTLRRSPETPDPTPAAAEAAEAP